MIDAVLGCQSLNHQSMVPGHLENQKYLVKNCHTKTHIKRDCHRYAVQAILFKLLYTLYIYFSGDVQPKHNGGKLITVSQVLHIFHHIVHHHLWITATICYYVKLIITARFEPKSMWTLKNTLYFL